MAGQSTPFGSVLTIMDVHNCLDDPTLDLGVLCTHTRINPWSLHKPINYYRSDGAALTDSDWACHSGLKTQAGTGIFQSLNALVYEPPINDSAHRRYRLSDFWYYNHNARRPSCVYSNLAILDTQSYNGYVDASIAIDLPNTEVLKALASDYTYAVNADILLICEYDSSKGFVVMTTNDTVNTIGGTAVRDGYNLAIYSLDGISETNYRISTSVRLNLYNKVVANKYSTTLYYLYGRRSQGDFGSWYIPGGESIYIDVKIISTGVNVQATISPIDGFPPAGISNNDSVNERGTLDATNHTFKFDYLELLGPVKSTAVNNFGNFKGLLSSGNYGTKWVIQYKIYNNTTNTWVESDWTNIPTPTYLNCEITWNYSTNSGTFRVYTSSIILPNCSAGCTVNLKVQYLNESLYWNYTS